MCTHRNKRSGQWLDGTGLLGTPTPVGAHFHALRVRIPGGSAHGDKRCFLVPVTYGATPHKKGVLALTFGVWILLGTQAVPLAKPGAGQGPGVKKMSKTMVQPWTWWSSLASVFRSSNPAGSEDQSTTQTWLSRGRCTDYSRKEGW